MAHHISQLESELQNIPEAAPKASPTFSASEKHARYGPSALSGVEHLTLLVGKESVALALIRHFGSLKALTRASFQELRQFLHGVRLSLFLNWRDRCRARGQAFLAEMRSLAKDRPQQLSFRFQDLS